MDRIQITSSTLCQDPMSLRGLHPCGPEMKHLCQWLVSLGDVPRARLEVAPELRPPCLLLPIPDTTASLVFRRAPDQSLPTLNEEKHVEGRTRGNWLLIDFFIDVR